MASSGAGAKSRRKAKRDALKRSKKNAMKAQYASWRDAGENSKSKRFQRKSKANKKVRLTLKTKAPPRMDPDVLNDNLNKTPMTWRQTHNTMSFKAYLKSIKE